MSSSICDSFRVFKKWKAATDRHGENTCIKMWVENCNHKLNPLVYVVLALGVDFPVVLSLQTPVPGGVNISDSSTEVSSGSGLENDDVGDWD